MRPSADHGWGRRIWTFLGFALLIFILWEGAKFIGGDPWRGEGWIWQPPIEIWFASDRLLPHLWDIVGALSAPVQRGSDSSLAQFLVGAALYTWREAALGKRFREDGLYTFVRWNYFFTNPPLTISEEELAEGFAIIDRALEITDAAVA